MFDLSIGKLLFLAVIALVIFGPNELPRIARQAGRALRDLRQIAEGARTDLREGLGPEFQDFDFDDLNPRRFVQKHLFDDLPPEETAQPEPAAAAEISSALEADTADVTVPDGSATAEQAEPDPRPPFDIEAT